MENKLKNLNSKILERVSIEELEERLELASSEGWMCDNCPCNGCDCYQDRGYGPELPTEA